MNNNVQTQIKIIKMTENEQRKHIIETIKKTLELNIANCNFMKKLYKDNKETVKILNKSIRQSKKALEYLPHIKHFELLRAIYGDLIGKISTQLMLGGTLISSPKTKYFDTEKGFEEFKEKQEEEIKIYEQKMKEKKESAEIIKKAKENGQKIEYLYENGKVRPVVVKENGEKKG